MPHHWWIRHSMFHISTRFYPSAVRQMIFRSDDTGKDLALALLLTTGSTFLPGRSDILLLTSWGRDKIAAILQTAFSNIFSWMKIVVFWFEFSLIFFPKSPINHKPLLVQVMTLCWKTRQTIIWTSDELFYCHIYITRPRWVNPSIAGAAYIRGPDLVTSVPAEGIAPDTGHWLGPDSI